MRKSEFARNRRLPPMQHKKMRFSDLTLFDYVHNGLYEKDFIHVNHIQRRAIPLGCNSLDLLIESEPLTGKTVIFTIIILEAFLSNVHKPQSLVLVATENNAIKTQANLVAIGSHTPGFSVCCFTDKLDIANDREKIKDCGAIIGTPDRILQLIKNDILNTDEISILVLDEANILTYSFLTDIKSIMCHLNSKPRSKLQVICASENYNNGLDIQLSQLMQNPIYITHKREVPIELEIKQFAYIMPTFDNTGAQETIAKFKAILRIFSEVQFNQCIIFSNTHSDADSCYKYLSENGWSTSVLLEQLNTFQSRILVTTDVAQRIQSENVNLVINLDMPADICTYLHRLGRCCRFGAQGMAVTLSAGKLELNQFQQLLGSVAGKTMIVYKFPHSLEIQDIWAYRSPDVRDKIIGTESGLPMKKRVPSFVYKQTLGMSMPDSFSDDEEWVVTATTKSIEPIQPENEDSGKKQEINIDQNISFVKATLLLTKNTKEELPELELSDPFKEYETLLKGKETFSESEETISRENTLSTFSIKNLQHTSVSDGSMDIVKVNLTTGEHSPINPEIDKHEPIFLHEGLFEALSFQELTTKCSISEFDSISDNDPFESIFESEIAERLPSPLIAVTKTEILPTFDTDSGSDMNIDVRPKSPLRKVQVCDTLKMNDDIVEYNIYDLKTYTSKCMDQHKTQCNDSTKIAIDLSNGKIDQSVIIQAGACHLMSSASMIPSADLINLDVSLEPPTIMSDTKFLNEDPFECLAKAILIDENAEPTEAVTSAELNDITARIELYLNTKNKPSQSPTDLIPFAFDVCANDESNKDTKDVIDDFIISDEEDASALSSYATDVDENIIVAEEIEAASCSDDTIVEETKDMAT